jgi:hypothetical protein
MSDNLWSAEDYIEMSCTKDKVGQPKDFTIWNLGDYRDGLCKPSQVNKSKVEPIAPVEPAARSKAPCQMYTLEEIGRMTLEEKNALVANATQDAILLHPGGPLNWMRENPAAHTKLAVKAISPVEQAQNVRVVIDVPWLQPDRLSYKTTVQIEDIQAIEDVSPIGWKEQSETTKVLGAIAKIDAQGS